MGVRMQPKFSLRKVSHWCDVKVLSVYQFPYMSVATVEFTADTLQHAALLIEFKCTCMVCEGACSITTVAV